ncbi:MAG: hypothetical protein M3430_01455 [Acidobacteriota bacterium]|nr:hypothetical protein [Acidobacteriota bacterium]
MIENVTGFFVLSLVTAGFWFLVFSKKARRLFSGRKPIWWLSGLYEDEKEGQQLSDGVAMTIAVMGALVSTIIFVLMLAVAIARFF